jgi:6-phosphogluconolactonase
MNFMPLKNYFLLLVGMFFCGVTACQSVSNGEQYLIIGTYTTAKSEGIYVYKFNTDTGDFSAVSKATGVSNPSFLSISPNQKFIYAVNENNETAAVSAFGFDKKSGILTSLNTQPSGGAHPCHLSTDNTGAWVLVGNYTGGSVAVLPILTDGSLGSPTQIVKHEGKGPNTTRQEKPHVHSVNIAANNTDVFVTDLGIDKIMAYRFDAKSGKLSAAKTPFIKISAGAGPRHFVFHPNGQFAYLIEELSSSITSFRYKKGVLSPLQTLTTLATDYKEKNKNFCADIHISPDGKFLYGSNRFVDTSSGKAVFANNNTVDSIVIYSIDPKTGRLVYVGHEPVLGKMPRNFIITPNGKYILVANQTTDNITIFERNPHTGKLTPTGKQIETPTAVCLKMMAVD